jgi:hypothetical protein
LKQEKHRKSSQKLPEIYVAFMSLNINCGFFCCKNYVEHSVQNACGPIRNHVVCRPTDLISLYRRLHAVSLQEASTLTAELSTDPSKIMNILNEIAAEGDGTY